LGYVKVKATISDPYKKRSDEIEFHVDTGAAYMVIPPSLAKELELQPVQKTRVTLADKREVDAGYAFAYVNVLGREAPVAVLIFESPMPLLGTFTLQVLGLEVDSTTEKVRPSRPFALGLMSTTLVEQTDKNVAGPPGSDPALSRVHSFSWRRETRSERTLS